ncbi:hypothetical protein FA13DRAFT_1738312 [Coprinellus micaceus]|uniref:Uncharacterized protein n=1 Tax=Coprinellus micaceus TaxID=71717 RepID=A0A4Y7SUB2_COPMI|nr:hypothetical protein FA13DRAFT_1738312 [Coprinellus micaceus]
MSVGDAMTPGNLRPNTHIFRYEGRQRYYRGAMEARCLYPEAVVVHGLEDAKGMEEESEYTKYGA